MKLCVRSMAITCAILLGGTMLLVGGVASARGPHDGGHFGSDFMLVMASIYPGYAGTAGWGQVVIGTLYGALDGAVAGFLLAWIYNRLASGARE